jgi:hypothetical protein
MAQTPEMNAWVGGTYTLQGNSMASRECINMYLQTGEGLAKYQNLLVGTAGTELLIDLETLVGSPTAACRGLWLTSASPYQGGSLYWVYGSKIGYTYKDEVTGLYVSKVLSDIGLSNNRVSITDNGFEVVFATGTQMILADIFTDVVSDITSTLPFQFPLQVAYFFGRVLAITADSTTTAAGGLGDAVKSNLIWYSNLANAKIWEGADFTAADLTADPILAIQVRQGDLWVFGSRSYQIFNTQSDANDPIQYIPGSGTYIGINAPYTAVSSASDVFWLGSNASGKNVVFKGSGYNSVRISNHGIESKLNQLGVLTDNAYAFSFTENGHLFYCLTIPSGTYVFEGQTVIFEGATYCYDTLTEQWHQKASREPLTGTLQAWQPLFTVFAWNKIVCGNLLWPVIMDLRQDVYTEYDPTTPDKRKPILRRFQGPIFFNTLQTFVMDEFLWDMVAGHGPLNGLSKAPVAQLQMSYDSGNTWGSISTASMQLTGNYYGRVRWLRLGSARSIVIRITITEDLQFMAGDARIRTRVSRNP